MATGDEAEAAGAARDAELAAWADRWGHDLMTPLAVISGMAETLEAAWDRLSATDRARLLASIRNQAARAMAMLEEGLAIARPAPPSPPPTPPGSPHR
ncbi:MAG: histidine kinase dimerization/phospho-acceptor domain-containing protein [Acidimicrobiales bacterium]